jgi:3-deoxy-7-phosphoheptulonate synthase
MIVIMQQQAGSGPTDTVVRRIEEAGFGAHVFRGAERDVIAVLGAGEPASLSDAILAVAGVERVEATTRAFKLASRDVLPAGTSFDIGSARLGGGLLAIVGTARPQPAGALVALAQAARDAGAELFWVGRGDEGELRHDLIGALGEIRSTVGLPVLVDVWESSEVDRLSRNADALQIPSPQMQQGVRTFETEVRAMLDLNAVAVARRLSHLPVLANPSLAAGKAEIVADLALAAAATGCAGVLLDADAPARDGVMAHRQALPIDQIAALIPRLKSARAAIGQ